jgi:hypothetical protein
MELGFLVAMGVFRDSVFGSDFAKLGEQFEFQQNIPITPIIHTFKRTFLQLPDVMACLPSSGFHHHFFY